MVMRWMLEQIVYISIPVLLLATHVAAGKFPLGASTSSSVKRG